MLGKAVPLWDLTLSHLKSLLQNKQAGVSLPQTLCYIYIYLLFYFMRVLYLYFEMDCESKLHIYVSFFTISFLSCFLLLSLFYLSALWTLFLE